MFFSRSRKFVVSLSRKYLGHLGELARPLISSALTWPCASLGRCMREPARSPSVCRASIVGLTAVCFIAFAEVTVFAFADVIGPLG